MGKVRVRKNASSQKHLSSKFSKTLSLCYTMKHREKSQGREPNTMAKFKACTSGMRIKSTAVELSG
jgi:hypothetical protein